MKSNDLGFATVAATLTEPLVNALVETAARPQTHAPGREISESFRFTPVVTLVLWLSFSLISVLGFTLPYARPLVALPPPEPLPVELLTVALTSDPLPELAPPAAGSLATPPAAEVVASLQLSQPVAVALPSPAVTFAVPEAGPARIVTAAQASYSTSAHTNNVAVTAPHVQSLTFGQGAGRQPAPEYPWRAQSEGQEGVVNVRFTVAENGRVLSAAAVNPSLWPLLNDSAVRTVRNRWRFSPGSLRAYEVAIRFVLPKARL